MLFKKSYLLSICNLIIFSFISADTTFTPKEYVSLPARSIKEVDVFEEVVGLAEKDVADPSDIICKSGHIQNVKTKEMYCHGSLSILSLDTLRKMTDCASMPGGGTFNLIVGQDKPWENWFRPCVDVGAMQSDPSNKDAVFQVASNFNCLEGGGDGGYGNIMSYLSPGMFVQGEAAAISAMPGLIYRMYHMPQSIEGALSIGQKARQINMLENLDKLVQVKKGYIDSINEEILARLLPGQIDELAGKICIGLHQDIAVPFGLTKQKSQVPNQGRYTTWEVISHPQKISQVFTAAINMSGFRAVSKGAIKLAKIALRAAYEGTLKSAFVSGKKKVFLTLVGGGVFANKLSWISEAIREAAGDFVAKSGMEVTLVVYHSGSYDKTQYQTFEMDMRSLVTATGGRVTIYTKDGVLEEVA